MACIYCFSSPSYFKWFSTGAWIMAGKLLFFLILAQASSLGSEEKQGS